jgi:hypothetical protein
MLDFGMSSVIAGKYSGHKHNTILCAMSTLRREMGALGSESDTLRDIYSRVASGMNGSE